MRARVSPGRVGWIFGSFAERDEALALLDDDGAAEPRDELGIGPLRDAFSNAFFPGITSPQTRAKYFLFVPAMYKRIEDDKSRRRRPSAALAELEQGLLDALLEAGDQDGVIGSKFKRVPTTPASAIYWTGVHTWGIRRFSDSRPRYHGWLQTPSRLLHLDQIEEDAEEEPPRWLSLPEEGQLLDAPDIRLSRAEASFLEGRVHALPARPGRPLLRQLLDVTFGPEPFWQSDFVRCGQADLSEEARDAERVSIAHNGAMRLYNALCAQQAGNNPAIEEWIGECEAWSARHPAERWQAWDMEQFWKRVEQLPNGPEAKVATEPFVGRWVSLLASGERLGSQGTARLIRDRERLTKPGRERLSWPFALAGWSREGLGVQPLDYRWRPASRIIRDIQEGLVR